MRLSPWHLAPPLLILAGCFGLDASKADLGPNVSDSADSGPVEVGALSADKSAIDFGTIAPGDDAAEAVVLTNGSDETLRVAASVTGDAVFDLSDADIALAPGGASTLTVTFSPSGEMTYGGNIGLALEDGSSLEVSLTGTGGTGGDDGGDDGGDNGGGTGAIAFSPTSQDLGTVDLGDTSSFTFTVENTGSDDVLIDSVSTSDTAFSVSGGTLSVPQVLSSGSSKTIAVTFTPSAERAYNADLTVHTDLAPATYTAALTGTGAELCGVCSPLISVDTGGDPYSVTDFTSVFGLEDERTWTIRNDGDEDLTVTSVSVNNDSLMTCGAFSISSFSGPDTVTPSGSTSFKIAYQASSVCLDVPNASFDENVVHILSNDPSQGDYVIEVGGVGLNF